MTCSRALVTTCLLILAGCTAPPEPPAPTYDPPAIQPETTIDIVVAATNRTPESPPLDWSQVNVTEPLQALDGWVRQAASQPNESFRYQMSDDSYQPLKSALVAAWKEQHDDWMRPDVYIRYNGQTIFYSVRAFTVH